MDPNEVWNLIKDKEYEGALKAVKGLNTCSPKGDILLKLGERFIFLGNFQLAQKLFQEVFTIGTRLKDNDLLATSLSYQALLSSQLGDLNQADQYLDQSDEIQKQGVGGKTNYYALNMRSLNSYLKGDLAKAREYIEKQIQVNTEINNVEGLAWGNYHLGKYHKDLLNLNAAKDHFAWTHP